MAMTVAREIAGVFDTLAGDYDARFSRSPLGALMRAAVWRELDGLFGPGDRVLELNCGTGEDAVRLARAGVHVLATDAARGMLEIAERKARAAGVQDRVRTRRLALEDLAAVRDLAAAADGAPDGALFDGALSNFGGLNCVEDLPAVARQLAAVLRPGAPVLLVVMGPVVPWEWAWYLARGRPGRAFRRLRPGGVAWRGTRVRYPSIARLKAAFRSGFRCRRVSALGALTPPTYAGGWAGRHPRLLARLFEAERRLGGVEAVAWLADHYVMRLERR